jgi:hypothetical protein
VAKTAKGDLPDNAQQKKKPVPGKAYPADQEAPREEKQGPFPAPTRGGDGGPNLDN